MHLGSLIKAPLKLDMGKISRFFPQPPFFNRDPDGPRLAAPLLPKDAPEANSRLKKSPRDDLFDAKTLDLALCLDCRTICQETLYGRCLDEDGQPVPKHLRLMADCVSICQLAAEFMMHGTLHDDVIYRTCAEICTACADVCDAVNDPELEACCSICRSCAAGVGAMLLRTARVA